MKHLGDITAIDWTEVEPVDVVIGGSPCQDLSVAGKRDGLAGERSGLFMEQIRCVKELRKADKQRGRSDYLLRPRFMVWENVPGAFSSNKGKDFAVVLEEVTKIIDPEAPSVPVPKSGWPTSGCCYDELGRWSIAWRVHNAQFWGVPQRRRRISLIADFGGLAAPEILFERKGLSWNPDESGETRKETTPGTGSGTDNASTLVLNDQGGSVMSVSEDISATLRAQEHGHQPIVAAFSAGQGPKAGGIGYQEEVSPSLKAAESGLNTVPTVYDARGNGDGKIACTITGDHQNRITDYTAIVTAVDCRSGIEDPNVNGTLQSKPNGGISLNLNNVVRKNSTVRRLTPMECERLQGYPDGWTDLGNWIDSNGKSRKEADSPRYKALGNSIALPFWKWLCKRISAQYEYDPTMGSLFDGIGGFPLCWERVNGKGTARWASEIEEFPMAVTKLRFPEED